MASSPASTRGTGRNSAAGRRRARCISHHGAQAVETRVTGGVAARLSATSHCTMTSARRMGIAGSSSRRRRMSVVRENCSDPKTRNGSRGRVTARKSARRHEHHALPSVREAAWPRQDPARRQPPAARAGRGRASTRPNRHLSRRQARQARTPPDRQSGRPSQDQESSARAGAVASLGLSAAGRTRKNTIVIMGCSLPLR